MYRTIPAHQKGTAVLSPRGFWRNSESPQGAKLLVARLREFRRTLEIIARILREVVNRVRLCGHHTHRSSRGEVHVYGAVM